ncbi:MAG: 2-C-methyl-D-erythritol 4-phosphate cytidylyltransferase [Elusimicrobia bacterium]|nr:MAG: 2-C-methyl-D-erythritol 4-phosphate cytidylyltransferase [Elusimicrobiota bacterium]KAF0156045.1 MAG: 2-C-methyl-D-erythritol 4-phosphate cytidylyltransferase [Elusimicrobiota bacterium]
MPRKPALPSPRAAVILAGGRGERMGGEKQFLDLAGKPLLLWSVETFLSSGLFGETVLVLSPERIKSDGGRFLAMGLKLAPAGATRMDSLRSGLAAVSPSAALVAVHDGARPLVTAGLIKACLAAAAEHGASVPAVPLKDTVKRPDPSGDFVAATLPRAELAAAQTPQCYRRDALDALLEAADGGDYTDESQLLERAGLPVRLVESDYSNIKVTTPEDLLIAEALMKGKTPVKKEKKTRFGFGYDIHRMAEGRPLILCGTRIPHNKGLLGHSDGDVVLHAVCDAALGSIAAGEIGIFFPPTDLTIMGISSVAIADKTMEVLKKRGARIQQIDATIVAEEPKLKPHYDEMRASLAKVFGMSLDDVSVKAKSREGLGDIGKGEAMACYAAVSVVA